MSEYNVRKITKKNEKENSQVMELLEKETIRKDRNLDYTCGIFDEENELIATGSCFGNTLRCLAVNSRYQGEGLMNMVITHLINYQFSRGIFHLFVYTKTTCAQVFKGLGFYEIAKIEDHLVFLENKKNGFSNFLSSLEQKEKRFSNAKSIASIVMNANPFSLGHQYLIEQAAKQNDLVHLFIVSEDSSIFPFPVREKLVMEGISHLDNVIVHSSGPYIISNATFPSYFQKDEESVIKGHALLDVLLFEKIAKRLNIDCRYVGEEPFSLVTNIYNQIMKQEFGKVGIELVEIKRKEKNGQIISASKIRQAIKEDNFTLVKDMVPETTLNFLLSDEALPIIKIIKQAPEVVHY